MQGGSSAKVCSGNRPESSFSILNLKTFPNMLGSGCECIFRFSYHESLAVAVSTPGVFSFYLSKFGIDGNGVDGSGGLTWDDLEDEPFCVEGSVVDQTGTGLSMMCKTPAGKEGDYVIFSIRDDGDESTVRFSSFSSNYEFFIRDRHEKET